MVRVRLLPSLFLAALAACSSSSSSSSSNPGPKITSVSQAALCSGGGALSLTGSHFQSGATVTVQAGAGVTATSVTVSADGTSAVAQFAAGLPAGGPYGVTLENPDGQSATLAAAIAVVANPQLFYVDPSVVYDGITVQATAYGAGFNEPVKAVSIVPSGGGTAIPLQFTEDPARPNQVQMVIPSGTAPGSYDVQLVDADCPGSLAKAVTVTSTVTLTLASLTPAQGWTGSTTPVAASTSPGSTFSPVPRAYLNPSSPGPGTVSAALGAVALVDAADLTAIVPAGLPVGSYDLIVVNPDGGVGVMHSAFSVLAAPPPSISGLSPGSLPNTSSQALVIAGANFRSPAVTLTCVDATGAVTAAPSVTVSSFTASSITATTNASGTTAAACAVRVTDGDGSFGDFSALVFTNPAQNLYAPLAGPSLSVARRAPVALGGDATSTARFLHVIGGDDGTGGLAMSTVETAPLSLLGAPGPFVTQRTQLVEPRAFAGGALIGRFLYVAGGSSVGAALDSVERAAVLDPADRGVLTSVVLAIDTSKPQRGLAPGLWYYRVAAVLDGTDPVNPTGENLPSDPFPVQLPNLNGPQFDVTVSWQAVPHAAKYRVYRSPTAGATVGTEEVVAEVLAPATTFTDHGDGAIVSTDNPLPVGSLGAWMALTAALATPREGPGVTWGMDPSDPTKAYLYVIGGRSDATTALKSIEILPITLGPDGTQTPAAAFVPATTQLQTARWQLGAAPATSQLSQHVPAGTTFVYALSGVAASGTMVSEAAAAEVATGGQLGAFTALPQLHRAGYAMAIAGDFVFAFGGLDAAPDTGIDSGEICDSSVLACAAATAPSIANWNAEGVNLTSARYLMGGTLSGAFIYVAGGVDVAGTPPALTGATEYFLW